MANNPQPENDFSDGPSTHEALQDFDAMMRERAPGFAESKAHSAWTRDQIIERLVAHAGSYSDELVSWFLWQDGVIDQPGPHPGLFLMLRPVGLNEAMTYIRLTPQGESAVTGSVNPWVAIADDGEHSLMCNVHTGEIYSIYVAGGESKRLAGSIIELVATWTELWQVGVGWDDEKKDFYAITPPSARLEELVEKSGY